MFLGKHPRSIDGSSRLSVPPAYIGSLASGAYITQGFDRNVQVLTTAAFEEIYRAVIALSITNPLARLLVRLVLGTAQQLVVEPGGQIIIPEDLRQFANLQNDIFVIGQGEYFEIWAPEAWALQEVQLRDAEANAGRFSTLTVSAAASAAAA